jgi:CubicO group peptidase (beta-lactamase class C family)
VDSFDDDRLAELVGLAASGVGPDGLPSCQLAVAHEGRVVLDVTIGAPGTTRYVVFSCTKAITASAVWLLIQEGLIRPDTRVAELVEGFGAHGKDSVTVEHLLTHTAGFPDAEIDHDQWMEPEQRIAVFGSWRAQWEPGSRFEYHGRSASWVLAHLIETTTGRDFRDWVRSEVLEPMGLGDITLGTLADPASSDFGDDLAAASLTAVGDGPDRRAAEALGLDISAIGADLESLLDHDDPTFRAVGQPAGGAIARAADLAVFYQALLGNADGPWTPETLAMGTAEIRCTMADPMTSVPANRTLGLVVAGDDGHAMMRGLGRSVSPSAFGHMGAGGQIAWADPASGLSFAYLTNGLDRDPVRLGMRSDTLSTAAGRCPARTAEPNR